MQHVYVHRVHHPPHFTHSRARFRLISCRCVVLFSHALGIVFNFVALQSSLMERRIPTCVSPSPTVPRYRALAEIQCSGAPRLSRHTVSHIICTHSAGAPRYPTNVICTCVRACVRACVRGQTEKTSAWNCCWYISWLITVSNALTTLVFVHTAPMQPTKQCGCLRV